MIRVERWEGDVSSFDFLLRIQRGKRGKMQAFRGGFRGYAVNGVHLEKSEIPFAFLGSPALAGNQIPRPQVELANLRSGDVDIFRARQVVDRPQEPEAFGQHLEHALHEHQAASFGLRAQDGDNQFFFLHLSVILDLMLFRELVQLGQFQPFEIVHH